MENKEPSQRKIKELIKNILGEVPLTAELYWLVRSRGKGFHSRFSLENLDKNIPTITEYLKEHPVENPEKKKILVFATLHFWISHASLISSALAALGHEVYLGYLPYHDWRISMNRFDLRRQNLYAQNILKKLNPYVKAFSFLNVYAGYKMLPPELMQRIEQISRFDTMYTLQVEDVDTDESIYKIRMERNSSTARSALAWMTSNKPDVVVVPNGTIQEFAVVYEVARFLNIPVVSYEFGDQRQRAWIAQNAKVMNQDTTALWEAYREKPLDRGELRKIQELFESRRKASIWKNFSRLWQRAPAKGVAQARKELGLDDSRPVVLLATNVLGDSLTLGREVFSHTMEEWIVRTLQYFVGKPNAQLVIRVHPGEMLTHGQSMVDVIEHVLPDLPEHIHLIKPEDPTNTYDLIAAADLGLVYTTTVGMEMAMSGVPVIVVGNTHYKEKGFTKDPQSWVKYYKLIGSILQDPSGYRLSDEEIELAWAYAYRFFFDFPRPIPWHLVSMWEDYEQNPLSRVFSDEGRREFEMTFRYLAGEPLDWCAIRDGKEK
ncbi:MAG: hypothetical protein GYA52_06835 [Chloroflexi bacterium]|nr:hypothetical protein [Chloroflexota bacterium]